MNGPYSAGPGYGQPAPRLDARRLWAGGLATAVVAALIAVVGVLVIQGLLELTVLVPAGMAAAGYVVAAAAGALVATALMHILASFTPRPVRFFEWVVSLVTVVAVLAPFTTGATFATKLATAILNLVLGVAIGSLVAGTTRGAVRRV